MIFLDYAKEFFCISPDKKNLATSKSKDKYPLVYNLITVTREILRVWVCVCVCVCVFMCVCQSERKKNVRMLFNLF